MMLSYAAQLFVSTFCFEDINYGAARNNFALHRIPPEDDFAAQPVEVGGDATKSAKNDIGVTAGNPRAAPGRAMCRTSDKT
jgi:hypothetical protein